jgi:methionyl-tRNA formyltransferase
MGDGQKVSPFAIVFITQEDPFYVRLFFEEFFKHYAHPDHIKSVVIAPTMGKKSLTKLLRQMYDFYGPWDFVSVGTKYVSYKLLDKVSHILPVGRFFSIAQLCRHHRIPVIKCLNLNADEFFDEIRRLRPDLIISVAAPQIFKEKLIRLPANGCINIHNSKLPKYRGMLPNFWQMYHGKSSVGTTIHRINSGIDDGDILLQRETPIEPGETLESVICKTKRLGAMMMIDVLNAMQTNSLTTLPNPSEESTYFTFPTRRHVIEFKKKGFRLR